MAKPDAVAKSAPAQRSDADDEALVLRAVAGELEAFESLVRRYSAALFVVVRNLLPVQADHADVVQDTFLSAFARLTTFDPRRGRFSSWLYAIARHRCANLRKKRTPQLLADEPKSVAPNDPEREMATRRAFRRLDQALEALPFHQRVAFVLVELHELPLTHVAEIEGVRLGTVKSRVSRAKRKLRTALEAEETGR